MVTRLLAVVLLIPLAGLFGAPAHAAGLVADGTSVEASESDGVFTADVTLINTGRVEVTLPAQVAVTDSCDAKLSDRSVGGRRSAAVTVELDEACFGDSESVDVDLDAGGPLPEVTITKPDGDPPWLPLGIGALIALVAAGLTGAAGLAMVDDINRRRRQPEGSSDSPEREKAAQEDADRESAYAKVKEQVDRRVESLGGNPLPWRETLPPPSDYGLTSEVRGLEAGWSFKDSWASNLTVAATAFVALLSSADALTAVLGEEPEAALGVMTVAGLISATVIAIANTVAKLLGDTPSMVTTGGLILSTSMVVFAAGLQVVTVGGTALTLADGFVAHLVVVLMTAATGVVLIWYAVASMRHTLETGAPGSPLPAVPVDAFDSWAVTEDWHGEIVRGRIEAAYAEWLTEPGVTLPAGYPGVPSRTLPTAPGDELPRRVRASLV